MNKSLYTIDNIKIYTIYLMYIFAGIIYKFNFLESFTNVLSGLFIILVAHYILYEVISKKHTQTENIISNYSKYYKTFFFIYFLFIAIITYFIEFIGVNSAYIFGRFSFTSKLIPNIYGVPLSVPFIWIISILSSLGIIQKFTKINLRLVSNIKKSLIIGFLISVFDYFLEMSVKHTLFWTWQIGIVPFQNYLAWFIFGSIFSYIGFKYQLFDVRLPKIVSHIYFAHLVFFLISSL